MTKKINLLLISVLLVTGLILGVSTIGSAKEDITIGVVDWASWHWWDKAVFDGIKEMSDELGFKVISLDSNIDHVKQGANVDTLITKKVDSIIFIIGDEVAMKPMAQKARDNGIATVFLGGGINIPSIQCSIMSNDYKIGQDLAKWMIDKMNGKGNIIVFQNPSQDSTRSRYEGMLSVVESNPNVKIVEDKVLEWTGDRLNAMKEMEVFLNKYPKGEIGAVWAAWDAPAYGAAEAIKAAGREEIFSVGINGEIASLNAIRQGMPFKATVAQRAKEFGRTGVEIAYRLIKGDRAVPREIYFPHVIYHEGNLPPEGDLGISTE